MVVWVYWLPIYYAVHGSENSGFDKAAACVRVAGETDPFDGAKSGEENSVPQGIISATRTAVEARLDA
jgi:hypothetical protein